MIWDSEPGGAKRSPTSCTTKSGSAILRKKTRVQNLSNILKPVAAAGLVCALVWAAETQKKVKDQGEYDIYNQAIKDAADPAKQIADLDTWNQKYADSEYKDDRVYLYMQAYLKMSPPQPAKVLEYGVQLMSKDLGAIFAGPGTEQVAGLPIKLTMLNVLYSVALNAAGLPDPTADQLALGDKAAHQLLEFAPKYFTPENKPAAQTDAAWNAARADVEGKARGAIIAIALKPGLAAQAKKDCPAQESGFAKALADYPDSGAAAYQYGVALLTCGRANPEKVSQALWEIARAASLDPAKSGLEAKDLPGIEAYLKKIYVSVHGGEDGLDQLKQQAVAFPTPAAGFKIKTATEIAAEKEAEFKEKYPQLAMWMGIKGQLADTNGEQYFQGQLKDTAVPKLKGTLVEAKPACRPKELLVAVPLPDAQKPYRPEITLKLDKPMGGKPEPDTEFQWDGVPGAFTKDPFMLTMDTETAKLDGLTTTPCTTPAARPGTKNVTANKKK